MPYQDGTGPRGTGPIGFRLGPCYRGNRYSYSRYYDWRGGERRRGYFRGGFLPGFEPPYVPIVEIENNPEEEKKWISQELEYIEKQQAELRKRLDDLNSEK